MNAAAMRKIVSSWPGVSEDVKWGADLVFSVAGKMFCVICTEGEHKGSLSFKVDAERFLEYTDRPGLKPAPYLARAHWVHLDDGKALPAAELKQCLRRSYELVRAKLPKKTQQALAD